MSVSRETMDKLKTYEALLHKWQRAVNLVSAGSLDTAWERHFEDSLQLVDLILNSNKPSSSRKRGSCGIEQEDSGFRRNDGEGWDDDDDKKRDGIEKLTLFDFGSGAGFPGMALAIARPNMDVHLVESDRKKCSFLKAVSRETAVPVTVYNERIEALETQVVPDVITARALASLDKLLGWCLPWAQANPALEMIFLKGEKAAAEIALAQEHFSFTYETLPSKTDNSGVIVRITALQNLT